MIALSVCLALLGIGIIVTPFLGTKQSSDLIDQTIHPVIKLKQRKESLLQSIRELDFDYETQKISKQDYQHLRAHIENQTIDVMKALETAQDQWETIKQL